MVGRLAEPSVRFIGPCGARSPRTAGKLGRALPNHEFPIYEGVRYGRGAGAGLDRGTGVDLGVVVAVGVGVAVAVAVGVAVGVGLCAAAQYLPPVLK
jgi:hypothetical protein